MAPIWITSLAGPVLGALDIGEVTYYRNGKAAEATV
jgi:hypothetical protein